MTGLSRREFLIGCTHTAAALALSRWVSLPSMSAVGQGFPSVSVAQGEDQDTPGEMLATALEGIGGMERFVKPGQTVAIKPNATWAYPPHTASSSDPEFLRAVIAAVQEAGAGRIIVMDHCSIEPGTVEALRISGIGRVVNDMGVEHIFPDRFNAPRSVYTKIELPHGRAYQEIGVIKAAVEADVRINLAVAKTHNVTKMTMCLKHMMGFLQIPGLLHAKLEQGIADLSTPSAIQSQLHLLEAIRVRMPYGSYRVCAGPETDLTHPHIVVRRNTVIAGTDPVLIDAYGCLHFYDAQPQELTHLQRAFDSGCGEMDVEAAQVDGRIRIFKVGEPVLPPATPTATATPHATSEEATSEPPLKTPTVVAPELQPTSTPKPTSTPVILSIAPAGPVEAACPPSGQVIDPRPILNTALIPAAAIISGASLVTLRRLSRGLPHKPETTDESTGQGEASPEGDHE
jgi:hypothetical protein